MISLKSTLTLPAAGLTGFETPLTEEEAAIQASVHRFAKEVLRPLGRELDRMTAEEVVAPGSPYYSLFAEFAKLGLDPALMGLAHSTYNNKKKKKTIKKQVNARRHRRS